MTNHEAIQFLNNMIGEEHGRSIGADGFYRELCAYHVDALRIAIKALEQEPKTGHWIPVSEGLPYIGERVLVTTETLDNGKMVTGTYYDRYGFVCGNVLAWMPLPKSYESQESEEQTGKER